MNINVKSLFTANEDTESYIKSLTDENNKITKRLFQIHSNTNNTAITPIETMNCPSSQFGFTWFLTGINGNGELVCITVGQAQKNRVNNEIKTIYNGLTGKYGDDNQYYQLTKRYRDISLFQVDIDAYITEEFNKEPLKTEDLNKLAFDLVKDYFAEVLIANKTASTYWNYYGSGMDKRFLFYLLEKYRKDFPCNIKIGDDNKS